MRRSGPLRSLSLSLSPLPVECMSTCVSVQLKVTLFDIVHLFFLQLTPPTGRHGASQDLQGRWSSVGNLRTVPAG